MDSCENSEQGFIDSVFLIEEQVNLNEYNVELDSNTSEVDDLEIFNIDGVEV